MCKETSDYFKLVGIKHFTKGETKKMIKAMLCKGYKSLFEIQKDYIWSISEGKFMKLDKAEEKFEWISEKELSECFDQIGQKIPKQETKNL